MAYLVELPHVDEDGYKVGAELTYLVLNGNLELVPARLEVELEWEKDERHPTDSCYVASLVMSDGTVIPLEVDDGGDLDSEGGDYVIYSFSLPELEGQSRGDSFFCNDFRFYLGLSVDSSRGIVKLYPSLAQSISHEMISGGGVL